MLVEVIKKLIELLKKHNAWEFTELIDPYNNMAQIDVLCELLANSGVLVHVDRTIFGSRFGSKMSCTTVLKSMSELRNWDCTIFTEVSFDFNGCTDKVIVDDLIEVLKEFNPVMVSETGFVCSLKESEAK